jgi:5-methylcytosine-specific restriction endonuclease McrA
LGNVGKNNQQEWVDLCGVHGNICLCCKKKDVKLTLDHVLPLKLGGLNTINNAQPLCLSCNSRKGARHIDYR